MPRLVTPPAGFYGPFRLDRAIGADRWFLAESLRYFSPSLRRKLIVPAGFATDFASIPRLLHRVLPKNGAYDAPAVLHDWCYRDPASNVTREQADDLFFEAMLLVGVAAWKARTMFLAVRVFGGAAYRDGIGSTGDH